MRILISIASYGENNDKFLDLSLQEFRKASYEKDIIVHSNLNKNLGNDIRCIVGLPNADPRSLVFAHRQLFIDNINNYDFFLYTEDDILITQQNIEAFLEINGMLLEHQVPGFIRYEVNQNNEKLLTDIHYNYHWLSKSVKLIKNKIFAELNNKHSGCYILTKSQLSIAIKSGNYSNFPRISAGGGVLESASADPFIDCGLEKVICLSDIDRFLVHHLPNNYVHKWGLRMCELRPQIEAMNKIANKTLINNCLLKEQTKLLTRSFDKKYHTFCDQNVVKKIVSNPQRILSVGCGDGSTEEKLVQMGHDVTAIPLDSIISPIAKKKGIKIISLDFEQPLTTSFNHKFDYILFLETLHYVSEPEKYLKTFINLLEQDGKIIATFMSINSSYYSRLINSEDCNFSVAVNNNNNSQYQDKNYDNFEVSGFNFINDYNIIGNWFKKAGFKINQIVYYPSSWKNRLVSIFSKKLTLLKSEKCIVIAQLKN